VWESLLRLLPEFEKKPEFGRSVLLREGYLYAERADLAFSIVQLVRADHLFDEPRIWVERGETLMHAELRGKRYVYVDGPHSGEPVRLLHFDRVGSGERSVAVHRDVRSLRYRLHFDRMQVAHMTDDHIVADLVYGKVTVRSLIRSAGARLELECEIVPHDERAAFARARELNRRQQRVLSVLRAPILEQIDEGLPFDEPKTEIGQQDGKLRPHWRQAYLRGESKYKFNDDEYKVFDKHGRPRVPQVCVDFVTDTLERSSGTWWRAAGNAPERVVGRLDLHEIPGFPLRRSAELVRFAAKNSGMFEVDVTPERERIELGDKPRFFRWLARQGDRYRAGDIVFIRGYTPWDDQELHYHSFFVYETDPVTGVPISLAGNAGSPSLRSFEVEARRTPQRSVWYRIRPQLEWLESIVFDGEQPSQEVPTLVRG
jgi:hypothetical protein